jgi:hypothetical protein
MNLNKRFLICTVLIFCLIYDISFVKFTGLTTGRIALLLFFIYLAASKEIKINKNCVYFIIFVSLIFIASLIQFISSNDFIQSSRLLWFSIYSIIVPFFFSKYLYNLKDFLFSFLLATSLQSIIAINSFFSPAVKQYISSVIVVGGNDLDEGIYRAISFSGPSGAALSIIQFCGVFAGLILVKFFSLSRLKSFMVWGAIVLCLFSTLITGRTGLLLSLLSIILFLLSMINFRRVVSFSVIIILISQINFISLLESQTESIPGFKVDFFLNWIGDAFSIKNNNTANAINKMPIPPLTLRTIFGTGEIFDYNSMKNASGNDSGYIQTYYSLGIILAFLFYIGYFLFILMCFKSKDSFLNSFLIYFIIFVMFVIELKEPFIFKYALPFFILNLILLSNKRN